MTNAPLMPMATAVWLVENTTLTFKQIANFCNLHEVEIQGIADGEVAKGIMAYNPIISGQLTREEIDLSSNDENRPLQIKNTDIEISNTEKKIKNPVKFYETFIFQFVNPKGVFAAITSISLFVELGSNYLFHSLVVIGVSFCVAITSITSWCLLGKFLRRFSENKKFIQMFNYAMSFSLVVCVILIYLKI